MRRGDVLVAERADRRDHLLAVIAAAAIDRHDLVAAEHADRLVGGDRAAGQRRDLRDLRVLALVERHRASAAPAPPPGCRCRRAIADFGRIVTVVLSSFATMFIDGPCGIEIGGGDVSVSYAVTPT